MKILLLLFALSFSVFGQTSDKAQPDRWRGLIIDEATPQKAIEILGKPDSDKLDSFRVYKIDKILTKQIREKTYRRLEYKSVEGFDKVILAFSNERLVFIELNPKKLSPNVLEGAYGIKLQPLFGKFEIAMHNDKYERDAGELKAKEYPVFYYLFSKSPNTFILASIGNSSIGSILGTSGINDGISFPGKVEQLQIISRTLENKDNADILK
jgi:hypothetical protein